ncbi:hypothetical protein ACMFMF_008853 [Clarireedia jacksonii]
MEKSIKSWSRGGGGGKSGSVKSFASSTGSRKKTKNAAANKEAERVQEEKKLVVEEEKYELGPWSDWFWSEEFRILYRGRKDRYDMWTYEIDTRSPEKHIPRFVPVPDIEYRVDAQDDVYYEEPGDYIFVTTTFEGVVVASDGNRDGGGEGDVMKDAPKKNQQDEVATQVDTRSKQGGEGCTCGCASGENGKGATGKQRKGDKYPRRRG